MAHWTDIATGGLKAAAPTAGGARGTPCNSTHRTVLPWLAIQANCVIGLSECWLVLACPAPLAILMTLCGMLLTICASWATEASRLRQCTHLLVVCARRALLALAPRRGTWIWAPRSGRAFEASSDVDRSADLRERACHTLVALIHRRSTHPAAPATCWAINAHIGRSSTELRTPSAHSARSANFRSCGALHRTECTWHARGALAGIIEAAGRTPGALRARLARCDGGSTNLRAPSALRTLLASAVIGCTNHAAPCPSPTLCALSRARTAPGALRTCCTDLSFVWIALPSRARPNLPAEHKDDSMQQRDTSTMNHCGSRVVQQACAAARKGGRRRICALPHKID